MDNKHTLWRQGRFIDQPQYKHWGPAAIEEAERTEALLVRPSQTGNAICRCTTPEEARWVADRLNIAARLERQMEPGEVGATQHFQIELIRALDFIEKTRAQWIHSIHAEEGEKICKEML